MATRVKDGIFVADGESSQDPEFIELNKIGYIVNCAGRQLPNLWSAHGVRYLTFTWDDDPNYTLFDTQDARCCVVVEQIVAFDDALAGESVLLHSFLGTGRHGTGFESVDSTAESLLLQQLDRSHALERSMAPERRLRELVRDVELGSPRRPPPQGHRDSLFLAKYRRGGGALPTTRSCPRSPGTPRPTARRPAARRRKPGAAPVRARVARRGGAAPFGSAPGRAGAQPSRKPRPGTPAAQARGGAPATQSRGPRPQGRGSSAAPPPQDRPLYYGAASLSMRTGRSPGGGGRPGSSGDRRHVHADFPDPFPANRVGALPKQLNAKHGRDASIEELMIRGAASSAAPPATARARGPPPRAGPTPRREPAPPRHAPDPSPATAGPSPRVSAPGGPRPSATADVPHRARPQY
ncbi:phosphatase [Aureococcus anophagefferens]|nr:phosphatase [Aureococcus anophagefferens]